MKKTTTIAALVLAVLAGLGLSCDNGEDEEVKPPAYVYVFGDHDVVFPLLRIDIKTGEIVKTFAFNGYCLGGAVNKNNGDIYYHPWNSLQRYDATGKKIFDVWVPTYRYQGREHIGYHHGQNRVIFVNGEGWTMTFNGDTGDSMSGNSTQADAEQLVVDEQDNRLWILGPEGGPLASYTLEGNDINTIGTGYICGFALETSSRTILASLYENSAYKLVRYNKGGAKLKEIPLPYYCPVVAIEPGSNIIWVSDGEKSRRYNHNGALLSECADIGFKRVAFSDDGAVIVGVSGDGVVFAAGTLNQRIIWKTAKYRENELPTSVAFYSPLSGQ